MTFKMDGKIFMVIASSFICLNLASMDPTLLPGHLKPFGSHMDPMPLEETEDIPDAKTFFEKYVLPSRPIVFRGAAKKFKAYSHWTEDYLVKNYGNLEVRLENKLEKDGYTPAGAKGIGRDTIEGFIKTYHDVPKYIVSELPTPMYEDMMVLPCMSCGPVRKRMVEIDIWMSSGSSQSILHKDAFNTMNCLINGTKDWKLVLYKHEKDVYKAHEEGDPGGGYSRINIRNVDMKKYPKIAQLPYYNITVHGGDCLFLPKSCYHQVNSHAGFNLAVTMLFSRFNLDKPTDFKDCNAKTEIFTPLSKFNIDWQYPGTGFMSMGYGETWETRHQLYLMVPKKGLAVHALMTHGRISTDPFDGKIIDKAYILDLFGIKEGEKITKQHIKALKKKQLRKLGVFMHPHLYTNSYEYEYYKISRPSIAKLLSILVKKDGVVKRDVFTEEYVKRLYGTKLYADNLFNDIAGKDSSEVNKDIILKNFAEATSKYKGDDFVDNLDPTMKFKDEEDPGEAYILVKKDIKYPHDEAFTSKLLALLPEESVERKGLLDGEEDGNEEEDGEEEEDEENPEEEGEENPEEEGKNGGYVEKKGNGEEKKNADTRDEL